METSPLMKQSTISYTVRGVFLLEANKNVMLYFANSVWKAIQTWLRAPKNNSFALLWHQIIWSALVRVTAWCMLVPSHEIHQRWLNVTESLGIYLRAILREKFPTNLSNIFENNRFQIFKKITWLSGLCKQSCFGQDTTILPLGAGTCDSLIQKHIHLCGSNILCTCIC